MRARLGGPPGRRYFEKLATDDASRRRLAAERAVLRRAAHPGVVRLIDDGVSAAPDQLRTRAVTGRCLALVEGLTAAQVLGLGSAVATTLADLHDVGIAHGALRAEHIIVGPDERPVLCGFSRGQVGKSVGGDDARADVAGLLALLADQWPEADQPPTVLSGPPPSARRLADRLAAPPESAARARPGPVRSVAAALVSASLIGGLITYLPASPARPRQPPSAHRASVRTAAARMATG